MILFYFNIDNCEQIVFALKNKKENHLTDAVLITLF